MSKEKKPALEPADELGDRTWEELEVVEDADGGLLFKDQIRRRAAGGGWTIEHVRVRVPRGKHHLLARANARRIFNAIENLDEARDQEEFEELEQFCLLALCIRTTEPPHAQFADPDELIEKYDPASLEDVLGRIHGYKRITDPRVGALTPEQTWAKIKQVAERGHLLPLTDIAGFEQPSLVVFMASQALLSPKAPSFVRSSESSTPERSPASSSTPS